MLMDDTMKSTPNADGWTLWLGDFRAGDSTRRRNETMHATRMSSSITIHNQLNESIVVLTYPAWDTVQLLPATRTDVSRHSVTNIVLGEAEGGRIRVHICRIGLFGMTSPRTRLTSGAGFSLIAGRTYCVRATAADDKGNLCSVHVFNPVDGTTSDVPSPAGYRFGDKLIWPALRLVGLASALDNDVFHDHMEASRGVVRPLPPPPPFPPPLPNRVTTAPPAPPPAAHIPEREIWGVFFEQTLHAAVRAFRVQRYITRDDLEMQEPFLFIGIPAVALMETVVRSLRDPDGLLFVDGRRVNAETCPEGFRQLFELLVETKSRLNAVRALEEHEAVWVRQVLLYAGSDKPFQCNGDILEERKDELRKAFSYLVSVSTQLTQEEYYKANFVNVLEAAVAWEPTSPEPATLREELVVDV